MVILNFSSNRTAKPGILILFLLAAFIFLLSSCKVVHPQSYVLKNIERDTIIDNIVAGDAEVKIQNTDILTVSVSSLNPEEDAVFNAPGTSNGYQVSGDGNIYIHKLGKVAVTGLTRKELKIKLEKELEPYFKDPIVTVNFENHRITMLGEMGNSKILNIPTEKISIFEALGQAGGTFDKTKLSNVVVIRDNGTKKEVKHLNLEDHSVFGSQWYYLQANDVVVLVPDKEKIDQEQRRQQGQLIATFVIQGVSLAMIIYSNFFRR